MTYSDWIRKGILLWICVANSLYSVFYARRYDKCLTLDGYEGVCVVRRYCREASNVPLIPCEDDDSFCCPIPTDQRSAQPFRPEVKNFQQGQPAVVSPDVDQEPSRFPTAVENKQPITRDEHFRNPVEPFGKTTEDRTKININDQRLNNNLSIYNNSPVTESVVSQSGKTTKPSTPNTQPLSEVDRNLPTNEPHKSRKHNSSNNRSTSEKSTITNTHRQGQDERPRKPATVEDSRLKYEDGRLQKPISSIGHSRPQIHAHDTLYEQSRFHDKNRPPTRTSPGGKVRFEDEAIVSNDDRQLTKHQTKQPTVDEGSHSVGKQRDRVHSSTEYGNRSEANSKVITESRNDENERKRRPPSHVPSHYPHKETIEFRENTTSREAPIKFPERYDFNVNQPKVPACGVKPYELFIAGGEASKAHEWPWMTAIFRRHQSSRPKTFLCGGSLINTKYVLTAAHCFVHNYVILPASSFVIRFGSHQLDSGEEYTVSNLIIHHNHSGSDFFNDIALVRVASEVYITDKIAPICLPFPGMVEEELVGRIATVAGWGDTAFKSGASRVLQHVAIPIVSGEECFAAYSRVRGAAFLARGSDHVVCAGLREGGKDACLGDSGGPLMLKTSDDSWVIVGIVSLGYKCAEPGYPGVYTRVTHYMQWIQTNMKSY